ncbi:LOW QUALITY PROTEIN: hypothetical protein CVT26_005548 [Gymnopilus dilepis]|uniref:Uncharacterized protein n=1 Tax=Gymnopilus dilepis TaxID=231916 RepID=A0A409XZR8_9AGAR|nr:LOW QUALITY PROTEIN: hypothetical protein CVT26_005548 [Gymnopilus dilepis]
MQYQPRVKGITSFFGNLTDVPGRSWNNLIQNRAKPAYPIIPGTREEGHQLTQRTAVFLIMAFSYLPYANLVTTDIAALVALGKAVVIAGLMIQSTPVRSMKLGCRLDVAQILRVSWAPRACRAFVMHIRYQIGLSPPSAIQKVLIEGLAVPIVSSVVLILSCPRFNMAAQPPNTVTQGGYTLKYFYLRVNTLALAE